MKYPVSTLFDGLLDRIFSVLGAVSLSQIPQFIQQYLQRLAGHADEAMRILERYQLAAERAGMEFDAYITRFKEDPDAIIAEHGIIMYEAVERAEFLTRAVEAIQSSNLFTRPFVFLANLDSDIAWAALQIYQPGVPTTIEGALYALTGILLGLLAYNAIKWPVYKFANNANSKD